MIATDVARRDAVWVHTYMDILAQLNRQAWLPWGEKWDMDPDGTNPRTNSYALLRTLIKQDADFFSATLNERIVGFGAGITLQPGFVETHEWWQPSRTFEVVPQYSDYELHMVFVDKEFRNNGVFKQLANIRLAYALQSGAPRIWLTPSRHRPGRLPSGISTRAATFASLAACPSKAVNASSWCARRQPGRSSGGRAGPSTGVWHTFLGKQLHLYQMLRWRGVFKLADKVTDTQGRGLVQHVPDLVQRAC